MSKNGMLKFSNVDFGEIRGVSVQNEPWLVGNDTATILGYKRPVNAVIEHVDMEDRLMLNKETRPQIRDEFDYKELGQRGGWLINESGFYALVFGSKLPKAKEFKHWVTHEVLPQIRKTGGYIPINREDDEKTILSKAVLIANNTIKLKDERITILDPQAEKYQKWLNIEDGLLSLGEAAKILGLGYGRNIMDRHLFKKKIFCHGGETGKCVLPAAPYDNDDSLFKVKSVTVKKGKKFSQTFVTSKGLEFLHKNLVKR